MYPREEHLATNTRITSSVALTSLECTIDLIRAFVAKDFWVRMNCLWFFLAGQKSVIKLLLIYLREEHFATNARITSSVAMTSLECTIELVHSCIRGKGFLGMNELLVIFLQAWIGYQTVSHISERRAFSHEYTNNFFRCIDFIGMHNWSCSFVHSRQSFFGYEWTACAFLAGQNRLSNCFSCIREKSI